MIGFTAPKIADQDLFIYIGDGRFHFEAVMIANPNIPAYRYDPYSKKFTRESYNHVEMYSLRTSAIEVAKKAKQFGLIQGTLGRQGSPKVMQYLKDLLTKKKIPFVCVLLSEMLVDRMSKFQNVDVWIQVACPRLSIDWGYAFSKPLLTPYEAAVVFDETPKWDAEGQSGVYPMDFYAKDSLGAWTPNFPTT